MPTAVDIANWFVGSIDRDAGDSITHLKVQKLVYYAQAWSLVLHGEQLFAEDFQAWAHGPVAETVYRNFEGSAWSALAPPEEMPVVSKKSEELLREILESYGGLSAKQLEALTHSEAPWIVARGSLPPEARSNSVISKQDMIAYYSKLHDEVESESEG
jgi:uncharacterized phage-associated protein